MFHILPILRYSTDLCTIIRYSVNCLCVVIERKKNDSCTCISPMHCLWGKNLPNWIFKKAYTEDIKCDIYRYVSSCLYSKKNIIIQYWHQKWYDMNFHLFCLFFLLELCHFVYLNRNTMVSFFWAMDLFDLPNPIIW